MTKSFLLLAALPASLPLAGLCLAISFLFTGIEAGLLAVNPARLRARARAGEAAAQRLERLLERPERLFATALLVTNFMDLAALALVTGVLAAEFGLQGYLLALVLAFPVYLLGVRLLPKALFRRFPFRTLALLAGMLEWASVLVSPVLALGGWLSRRLGLGSAFNPLRLSIAREQFASLLTSDSSSLSPRQREMALHALGFRRVQVGTLSRTLPDPLELRADATLSELLAQVPAGAEVVQLRRPGTTEPAALERLSDLVLGRNPDSRVGDLPAPLEVAAADPAHRVLRQLRAERREAALVRLPEGGLRVILADDLAFALLAGARGRSAR
ncbi:MAG: DUF21 domain-containing protein [Verrucomicrobia bacterium]|nr:DUF21 domain-containing protein [Verrucomicrobiota bacterium]